MNKLNIPVKAQEDRNLYMKFYNEGKITCECGCIIAKSRKYAHKNTEKHKLMMKIKTLSV
jgi:hypothetical protein